MKRGLKLNPGLALIGLRTTGPEPYFFLAISSHGNSRKDWQEKVQHRVFSYDKFLPNANMADLSAVRALIARKRG